MPSAESSGPDGNTEGGDRRRFRPIGEETVHAGRVVTLVTATFSDPGGTVFQRDIVRHPGAVAVVPMTSADSVLLVRQYRSAIDEWILEIPAGTCDVAGEPTVDTARRELAEEVGVEAAELSLLTRCVMTPGFCDEVASIYLATGLTVVATGRSGPEEEHMSVEEIPLDRFDAMVDDGSIVDASTILGVGLARRRVGSAPGAGR